MSWHGGARRSKLSPNSSLTGHGPGPLPQLSYFPFLGYWGWDESLPSAMGWFRNGVTLEDPGAHTL